jgi:ring-1,2-phenylacetyl-CoA epoxidase subunit PaaC
VSAVSEVHASPAGANPTGASGSSTGEAGALVGARMRYVLRIADLSLVLGQRLGEWIGHAPALEEDLGLANIALDLLGQARLLLAYAAELEGRGRGEDDLAFLRTQGEYFNPTLAEQPNGDFAQTIVRQVLIDAYQLALFEGLAHSTDERLAGIAAKAVKETRYHLRYSADWLVRLGDGTAESHARAQSALDRLWPYTRELTEEDALDRDMAAAGIGPALSDVRTAWTVEIDRLLEQATLKRPAERYHRWFGKRGEHSEHLGYLLAEMQWMQRTYPGARW